MADDRNLQHDSLLEDLKGVRQWQSLGAALGVPQATMDDIHRRHSDDVTGCQRGILNEWILANPECKWGDLVFALQKIGENHTANNVSRKYFGAQFRPSIFEKTTPQKGKTPKKVATKDSILASPSSSPQEEATPSRSENPPNLRDDESGSSAPSTQDPTPSGSHGEVPAGRHNDPSSHTSPDPPSSGTATPPITQRPRPLRQHDYYCYFVLPLLALIFGVVAFQLFRRMRHVR